MKRHNILLTSIFTTLLFFNLQEAKSQINVDLNSTITSRHYWRGIMVSNSVNYEGDLVLHAKDFSFGAWGGYAFDNTYSEFDFHMAWQISDRLSFSVWDLYASRDRCSIDDYNYFDFDRKSTNHLLDASVNYVVGEKFPLKISWSTMLWGRDLDAKGNQNYSSYLEVGYPLVTGATNINLFAGLNIFENSTYGEHTNIVNMGLTATKKIKLTENFQIPVWGTIAINPEAESANLIFGLKF